MAVCGKLNVGISYLCDAINLEGLDQREVVIGNWDDIDFGTTVINHDNTTNTHNVSLLNLVGGSVVYPFEGVPNRQVLYASYTKNEGDFIDSFIHTVGIGFYNQCEETLATLNNFVNGAKLFAIVKQAQGGTDNECAYQIYGLESGLKAGELTYNSNESNGIIVLPLVSKEPAFERYSPYKYEETDFATTAAKIETLKTGV